MRRPKLAPCGRMAIVRVTRRIRPTRRSHNLEAAARWEDCRHRICSQIRFPSIQGDLSMKTLLTHWLQLWLLLASFAATLPMSMRSRYPGNSRVEVDRHGLYSLVGRAFDALSGGQQARAVSGDGVPWRHPYGEPQAREAVPQASVWLLDYAGSVIPRQGQSVLQRGATRNYADTGEDRVDLLHTGPVKRAGGVRERRFTRPRSMAGLIPYHSNSIRTWEPMTNIVRWFARPLATARRSPGPYSPAYRHGRRFPPGCAGLPRLRRYVHDGGDRKED